jgi:predicted GNAT family N-acyltransferase
MIEKVNSMEELAPFGDTVLGCRILSTAEAYGLDEPFAQFWMQENHAVLCKLDDAVILEADETADLEEILNLVRMVGANHLICSTGVAERLGLPQAVSGEVMVYHNTMPAQRANFELNPSPRELYALLCDCATNTFIPPEFEPFYLDLSHRTRHGAAVAAGIRENDVLVSCAICTAHTEDSAIISAVATRPERRKEGFGRKALEALLTQLVGKKIYILRAQNENEAFYRSFGFEPAGGFAELIL